MAVKKAFIHLGMSKTGSTSIQNALFNNTAALEKNSFRYLSEWGENHLFDFHNLLSPHPVHPRATGTLGKPIANLKQKNKTAIGKMQKVIDTTECETLVFSGEYFHELYLNATIDNIKGFVEKYFQNNGIEATIIYLIRNPLTWMISFLQQRLYKNGFMNKDVDYFEAKIKQYEGIINLKNNFSDSLKILKFEDACSDKDGLVGFFLKAIGLPDEELKNIAISRSNDSKCMEIMEFIYYLESVDPLYPYNNYRRFNKNRFAGDLRALGNINGIKFDLPYQSKMELWKRLKKTLYSLKENTGIDYTDYTISPSSSQEMYSEETIQGFIAAFPKLSITLQNHFLKFFEKKYMETAQVKFKALHFKDSIPYKIYNSKNISFYLPVFRLKNSLRNFFPQRRKAAKKRGK